MLNVLLIGPAAQFGLWLIPQQTEPWIQVALFTAGLVLLAIATGLYIGPRMGPGPRDGLMTGLHARTGWPIWSVRTGIEVTVLIIGWFLGGNVGIGTLAFAVLIGPLCSLTLPLFAIRLPEAAKADAQERELEGSAEQAVQYDVREGLLLESDAGSRDRAMRRATSSAIGAHGADRSRHGAPRGCTHDRGLLARRPPVRSAPPRGPGHREWPTRPTTDALATSEWILTGPECASRAPSRHFGPVSADSLEAGAGGLQPSGRGRGDAYRLRSAYAFIASRTNSAPAWPP